MKILHVITGLQKAAGTSVFCGELANELVAKGELVTIAVVNPKNNDHYPLDSKIRLNSIEDVLKLSRAFDVVHIHALWSPILHRILNWTRRHGIPVIWSPHGMLAPWAMAHKWWKKILPWYFFQRRDLKQAAVLHATSEMEAIWIRDRGFTQKTVIVPLGAHLPPPVLPRDHEIKTILFVGRIYPVKGLASLIVAWSILPSDIRCGWQMRLVGPDQAGHKDELVRLAERIGVAQNVCFDGALFGENLLLAYHEADLFVLPSFTENFGGVVVDAMSHGVPVITTKGTPWAELEGIAEWQGGRVAGERDGGLAGWQGVRKMPREGSSTYPAKLATPANPAIAANGRCGWWIDIGVEPLAEALREAMRLSDEERHMMGENGRRLVEAKYNWPVIAAQMTATYEWLVTGGEGPTCVRVP